MPSNAEQYAPLVTAVATRRSAGWQVSCEQTFVIQNNGSAELIADAPDDIWWQPKNLLAGTIDLLMVAPDGKSAIINDWKTNKSAKYAKQEQIDLYALAVLLALPDVAHVTGCLMFICDNYKMVRSNYTRADIPRLLDEWKRKTRIIQAATVTDNFPEAEYTPLCGWCPCNECPNWQQGQDYRARRSKRR